MKSHRQERAFLLSLEWLNLVDLLYFFPRRYEDRSHFCLISKLQPGQTVNLSGEVLAVRLRRIHRLQILEMTVGDTSGMMHAVWFNQPYLKKQTLLFRG